MTQAPSIATLKTQVSKQSYDAFRQFLNSNIVPTTRSIGEKVHLFENTFAICPSLAVTDRREIFKTYDLNYFTRALLGTNIDLLTILGADLDVYKACNHEGYQCFLNQLSNNKNLKGIAFGNAFPSHSTDLADVTRKNKSIQYVAHTPRDPLDIAPFISGLGTQVDSLKLHGQDITDQVLLGPIVNGLKNKPTLTNLSLRNTALTDAGVIQFSNLINEANLTETPINLLNMSVSAQSLSDAAKQQLYAALKAVKKRMVNTTRARLRAMEYNKLLDLATKPLPQNNASDNAENAPIVNKQTITALITSIKTYQTPQTNSKTKQEFDELNQLLYRGSDDKGRVYCTPSLLGQITAYAYGKAELSEAELRKTHQHFKAVIAHHSKEPNNRSENDPQRTQLSVFLPFDASTFQSKLQQQAPSSAETALDSNVKSLSTDNKKKGSIT